MRRETEAQRQKRLFDICNALLALFEDTLKEEGKGEVFSLFECQVSAFMMALRRSSMSADDVVRHTSKLVSDVSQTMLVVEELVHEPR